MKVLSKYTKVTDTETLAQLHQTYGVRYSGDRIPYVRAEGVDEILKRTPGKEAREAKADEFIDNSLLKELEQSGWFRTAGTLRSCASSSLEGRVGLGNSSCASFLLTAHQVAALDTTKPRECPCPTYTADLSKAHTFQDLFKNVDAVVHLARQRFPYTETGFNTVAQRWEFPDTVGDAERFNLNVAMTNNVLAAARVAGVKKIVCGSSLAIYGLYYPVTALQPDYLPVDEDHPLRPQDPYGLSKLVGEKLCEAASLNGDMQIASLRFSGIYTEEHRGLLMERRKNPIIRGTGALWSYIDVRDAARACRLALEANFPGHQTFNLCAPDTIMDMPTAELAERYLPAGESRCAKPMADGAATISRRRKRYWASAPSCYCTTKAATLFALP